MAHHKIPAVFARGGTSKAVIFKAGDLPSGRHDRDRLFCRVLGSPDAYGRQLDGLGGGISSLSKIVIVGPPSRSDADVDFTFAQVAVDRAVVDYAGTCGNMSSAVGPFAVDEGLVEARDGEARVRVHNTNTGKIFHARFQVADGRTIEDGDFEIPGISGTGAVIRLDYLNPGGAMTGALLPTGRPRNTLVVDGVGTLDVSLIDATNPLVIARASDLGLTGLETPQDLEQMPQTLARIDHVRRAGGVAMGLAPTPTAVAYANPKIALISAPVAQRALDERAYEAGDMTLNVRMVSMGNPHRAVTLTGALCLAAALRIEGTIADDVAGGNGRGDTPIRLGNPSGVLPVDAEVSYDPGTRAWTAKRTTSYRTQRRLMDGWVYA